MAKYGTTTRFKAIYEMQETSLQLAFNTPYQSIYSKPKSTASVGDVMTRALHFGTSNQHLID